MILDSQQMFMLFFSILYGIMLNSLIGRGAFPITSALSFRDMVGRWNDNGEPIWGRGYTSLRRLFLSVAVLNIAPLVYFAIVFQFIRFIGDISSSCPINTITRILSIGLISLSVFAFYYFFLGLAILQVYGRPAFYTPFQYREQLKNRAFYPSTKNHIVAGFLYLLVPWIITVFFKAIGL